jgi:hypothetical protein
MKFILISLISSVIAQQGILLSVCSSGTPCYNRNPDLGICGAINGRHEYCVINGPNQSDPQIGYVGPCDSGSAFDNLCINCVTGEICSLGNLLNVNYTLDSDHFDNEWYSGHTPCEPANYLLPTPPYTVYNQCILFSICPIGREGTTYPCQTPKQVYAGDLYNFQNGCLLEGSTSALRTTGTGLLSGPCPDGLVCTIPYYDYQGLCVVSLGSGLG